jgi:polyisoprenoid-binding protein YceI
MTTRSMNSCPYVRLGVLVSAVCILAASARANQMTIQLDPAATTVEFTLGATMHTVHGTFKLKTGQVSFDPDTGKASGEIVVDAASADTDNASRDKKMHSDVLESAKFQEILFKPAHVTGSVARTGKSQVQISGVFRLHGQEHPANLDMSVVSDPDGTVRASTKFPVPYVQWGLKNPSTFLLHVSDTVDLQVNATGHFAAPSSH